MKVVDTHDCLDPEEKSILEELIASEYIFKVLDLMIVKNFY